MLFTFYMKIFGVKEVSENAVGCTVTLLGIVIAALTAMVVIKIGDLIF